MTLYRGSGGAVFDLSEPLSEQMQQQVTRGELVEVDSAGSPTASNPPARPKPTAGKAEWVGYAVAVARAAGEPITIDDADAMTKSDLIEKFGT